MCVSFGFMPLFFKQTKQVPSMFCCFNSVIFNHFSEAMAFSCFTELMKRMNQNFPHGGAMDTHFANMRSLIQVKHPLCEYYTLRKYIFLYINILNNLIYTKLIQMNTFLIYYNILPFYVRNCHFPIIEIYKLFISLLSF